MNLMANSPGKYSFLLLIILSVLYQINTVTSFYVNLSPDEEVATLLKKLTESIDQEYYDEESYLETVPPDLSRGDIYSNLYDSKELPDTIFQKSKRKSDGDLIPIDKRYTKAQDSALDYCTGQCMYLERQPYSKCYTLCHWTGNGPSPWVSYYKEKAEKANQAAMRARELNGASKVYRTGGMDSEAEPGTWKWNTGDGSNDWSRPLSAPSSESSNPPVRQVNVQGRRLKMKPKTPANAPTLRSGSSNDKSNQDNKKNNRGSLNRSGTDKNIKFSKTAGHQKHDDKCSCAKS